MRATAAKEALRAPSRKIRYAMMSMMPLTHFAAIRQEANERIRALLRKAEQPIYEAQRDRKAFSP